MSEWFRDFQRSREKPNPVRQRSTQVPQMYRKGDEPPPPPVHVPASAAGWHDFPETPEMRLVENDIAKMKAEYVQINTKLGDKLPGVDPATRNEIRQKWKIRLAEIQPKLLAAKIQLKQLRQAARDAIGAPNQQAPGDREDLAKATAIIVMLRAIVSVLEDKTPEEDEALRASGAFLKARGVLP